MFEKDLDDGLNLSEPHIHLRSFPKEIRTFHATVHCLHLIIESILTVQYLSLERQTNMGNCGKSETESQYHPRKRTYLCIIEEFESSGNDSSYATPDHIASTQN
jgi:hypothetical protein